ncbi:MAG: trigger factor [Phaeodactylibacter sp.]|nr:trigger factor [Phaeodactylibacter sp.]MCB9264376.1 trigger factor [Lewinellaceae bacterium]MCB9286035.1 trigger factor [Lewinellaceae bacterium]
MPKVVREDIDNLNAVLTVTLEKKDYEPKFNSELSKYRKQAHMKGFRKGKTPVSVLKKMYGKSVLADVINEMLQKELYDYLNNEDMKILGQPLPADDQPPIDFELRELHDYTFKFDLGLAPEFEVEGVSPESTFGKIEVEVTDEMIDEELDAARKRHGERQFVEDEIRENDMVKLLAKELDGVEVKEDGVESEFSLLASAISDENAKKQLLNGKKGDTFRFDLFELEEDKDEAYVRKYFLNLSDDDEREVGREYEVTVEEVSRIVPAELNQEFFDKFFGEGKVSSEEEAREQIREQIEKFYNGQSEALLFRDIQDKLMEINELPLPEDFLKRWMKATNEKLTDEVIEKEYGAFSKNLQWSLIRSKLVKRFDIQVGKEEVLETLKNRVRSYFGGVAPGMEHIIDSTAARLMEDEKQVEQAYDEVLSDKLYEAIADEVNVEVNKASLEEFEAEVAKAREASAAAQGYPSGEEEE